VCDNLPPAPFAAPAEYSRRRARDLLLQVMITKRAEGRVILRPSVPFDGVKVFSATLFNDRQQLGDKVTAWIADNPRNQLTEIIVTQSSDASFHCIALTVFFRTAHAAAS
jgi:hypothetical protein